MKAYKLFLFSRQGCCLCEGLEGRLRDLNLDQLSPQLELCVIDIDGQTAEKYRNQYDLLVPVMAFGKNLEVDLIVLPRVSPRLKGSELFSWLQKACSGQLHND